MSSSETVVYIELGQARLMLEAMGYQCAGLDQVVDIPMPVLEALRHAWDSIRRGELQPGEIGQIVTGIYAALAAGGMPGPAVPGYCSGPLFTNQRKPQHGRNT